MANMTPKAILALLLALSSFGWSQTQGSPVDSFRRFSKADGLSQNQVHALAVDASGFLWIATSDGLNRFDGYEFIQYRNDPDDPGSLRNNYCYALVYDPARNCLWIGTYGDGLDRYDIGRDVFTPVRLPTAGAGSGDREILALLIDPAGRLWAGSDHLFRLDAGGTDFELVTTLRDRRSDSFKARITAIAVQDERYLVIGAKQGLWRIDGGSLQVQELAIASEPDKVEVWSLARGSGGEIWMGSADRGLYRSDTPGGLNLTPVAVGRGDQAAPAVNCLALDPRQRLWIGTYGQGLFCLSPGQAELSHMAYDTSRPDSLSNDYINCILPTADQLVWIGTENGLCRYDPEQERISRLDSSSVSPVALPHDDISSLLEDDRGNLWIGTSGAGIVRLSAADAQARRFSRDGTAACKISNDTILKLVQDRDGCIWAASADGLNRIAPALPSVTVYRHQADKRQSAPSDLLVTLFVDRRNRLWTGSTDHGASRLDIASGAWTHLAELGIPGQSVWCFWQDRDRTVWIGCKEGLVHLSADDRLIDWFRHEAGRDGSLSHDWIYALYRDTQNRLWVGTAGGGLNRFDDRDKKFRCFDHRAGLPGDDILSILQDEGRQLWLSTNQGLCRLDPESGRVQIVAFSYRQDKPEYNLDSAARLQDGRLAYGSGSGLYRFFPADLLTAKPASPLRFTGLSINNQPQRIIPPLFERRQIRLDYSRSIISIEFAALDFRDAAELRYRFRLSGWKDQWLETTSRNRRATFSQLPPGHFVLEAQALNPDGSAAGVVRQLRIDIPAPFWRSPWFIALGGLAFAIVSYLLIGFLSTYLNLRRFWKKTTRIGNYRIGKLIGSGGMADVYAGSSLTRPQQRVAIKILRDDLRSDPISLRRFRLEAAIIDQLDHPNIIRIFERGSRGERPYIVMELLQGIPLAQKIAADQGTSLAQAAPIIVQVCRALQEIHRKGILHRDLKPANIMLLEAPQGETTVKLLDFGLARMTHHSRLTQSGTVMGTLCYLAPELISQGLASPASDIFSLGVVVFELLSGSLPYSGCSAGDILNQILIESPPPLSEKGVAVPMDIEALLRRILDKRPENRPDCREIVTAFARTIQAD